MQKLSKTKVAALTMAILAIAVVGAAFAQGSECAPDTWADEIPVKMRHYPNGNTKWDLAMPSDQQVCRVIDEGGCYQRKGRDGVEKKTCRFQVKCYDRLFYRVTHWKTVGTDRGGGTISEGVATKTLESLGCFKVP